MKKKILIGIDVLLIVILIILIAFKLNKKSIVITSDEKKFKNEYESLNGKKNANGKKYMTIEIPENNNVKYATSKEIIKLLKSGTGVIYFGFPECPWCRNALPVLLDATDCSCQEDIYYFNALSIRDIKHLDDDGKIVTDQKGTSDYYEIVKLLGDNLGAYNGLNDESIKRLYFPTIVFVKDGKIVSTHISTLDSQEDPYQNLTKKQEKELKNIYEDGIKKLKTSSTTCDIKGKTSC